VAEPIIVDERWFGEFTDYGLHELDEYLDRHARFDAYYEGRRGTTQETTEGGGDGSQEASR
jgi:hypothetical protein